VNTVRNLDPWEPIDPHVTGILGPQLERILGILRPVTWPDLLLIGIHLRVRFRRVDFQSDTRCVVFADTVYINARGSAKRRLEDACHGLGHLIYHAQREHLYVCPFGSLREEVEASIVEESLLYNDQATSVRLVQSKIVTPPPFFETGEVRDDV
jgi:hypothetical protein